MISSRTGAASASQHRPSGYRGYLRAPARPTPGTASRSPALVGASSVSTSTVVPSKRKPCRSRHVGLEAADQVQVDCQGAAGRRALPTAAGRRRATDDISARTACSRSPGATGIETCWRSASQRAAADAHSRPTPCRSAAPCAACAATPAMRPDPWAAAPRILARQV